MKKYLVVFCVTIFAILSCEKNQEEIVELNSFLNISYEFNSKTLNVQKGKYYMRVEEQPREKNEQLNKLDVKFEALIADIETTLEEKETNIEKIITRYEELLKEIPQIVKHNKGYLITELDAKIYDKTNARDFRLNLVKNKLVMAMSYAFEFINRPRYIACGIGKVVRVNTNIKHTNDASVKLTLSSDFIQTIQENRQIMVNTIHRNGTKTKANPIIKENHSFADITLDSLQKGNYKLNGVVRFYERTGKIDIPFEENFIVK